MISSSQRPLPDNTQHSQQTDIPQSQKASDCTATGTGYLLNIKILYCQHNGFLGSARYQPDYFTNGDALYLLCGQKWRFSTHSHYFRSTRSSSNELSVYITDMECLCVPVTTSWRILRLRMQERPPIWRVAANKLNKQSWTADKRWSSSLGVGRGAINSSP